MGNYANDLGESEGELSERQALRVRDLLTHPAFAGVHVVAGGAGLDRVVRRANVMEVPDIIDWVKPHELLLTTGYPLREVPGGLATLVASLDDAQVAALAVKLRYLDELPPAMIAEADGRGLPLLLLPDEVAFDDLLSATMSGVLEQRAPVMEQGEQVHQALLDVVLGGGGIGELVDALRDHIDGLTLATTVDGRVLAHSDAPDVDLELLLQDAEICAETGRFRSERFAPGVHKVGGWWLSVAPVLAGASDHGRLVVVRREDSTSAVDMYVLERAARVAALAITKALAVSVVEAKYRGDFVRDVLVGRAGSPDTVSAHFLSLGWDVAHPLVVVVAALDPLVSDESSREGFRTAQERFANAWVNVVGRYDRSTPVVGFAQEVVALVGVDDNESARESVDALVRAVSGDGGGGRRSFSTGVSRVVETPALIGRGYEQARRAVHVGRQLQGTSAVAHFDDLGAFRLLSLIEDAGELRSFVGEVLHELADEDDPEAGDMRATLRTLLDTNFNVAETSRRLHFHYNTLRYRITKLERILGPFISDPDLQLDLALALRVMQMRGL